ncbi:MAG: DUF1990 domain-containing protein [Pyrinomonadaceae bacterium]|nr:DUF1990 domain-containing protein [Pyrinomonadaceae bacterium]
MSNMFTLFEPSDEQIENFVAAQRDLPFSYREVGASQSRIPAGYPINHHRIQLGIGADAFARAKAALQSWTMYRLEWTHLYPINPPIAVGEVVCVIANHRFCRSLNPCRIIYVLEEAGGAAERYGFAFGTLPGHSEEGEERFIVEWRRDDDSVWYEILSFARPHHILAKIGFPFVGLFQQKFGIDSKRAMLGAVKDK